MSSLQQAAQLYESVLGRAPENAEVAQAWAGYIDSVGLEGARDAFMQAAAPELDARSQEIASNLYETVLGREPENQQVAQAWADYVEDVGVAGARNAFMQAASPELDTRSPELVDLLYDKFLTRDPESIQAAQYWSDYIEKVGFEEAEKAFRQAAQVELDTRNKPTTKPIPTTPTKPGTQTPVTTRPISASQSTLSPNFADYVYRMLAKGEQAANLPFQPFTEERFAQMAPALQQGIGAYMNLEPPSQFAEASGIARSAAEQAAAGAQYMPWMYNARTFANPMAAYEYMSPYMQAVVDAQQREAVRASDIARQSRQAQFAQRGAYGGARQAIEEAEAQRNLQTRLGDIQATGLQSAYQQAQDQFNKEQQARLEAQKASEASRQFGAGYGLKSIEPQIEAARAMGALGVSSGDYLLRGLSGMMEAGKTQQQLSQQPYDFGYEQWKQSQQYPFYTGTYMSSLLSGLPLSAAPYNAGTSGLGGLLQGLGLGMGAYKLFD